MAFVAALKDSELKAPEISKKTPKAYFFVNIPDSILSTALDRAVSVPLPLLKACWALHSGFLVKFVSSRWNKIKRSSPLSRKEHRLIGLKELALS
jgi:hypothetical protein